MKKNFLLWMGVVLIMVIGMSSCSSDDEKKDDRYIITGQPSTIGFSHAILTGEFYLENIPEAYQSSTAYLRLGVQLSLTEEFIEGQLYDVYIGGLEGHRMEITVDGLSPNTEYYYRAFVDIGTMKLYGGKEKFRTSTMQLACSVGDATDIKTNSATFTVSPNESAVKSSPDIINYGLVYSTNKDSFSDPQGDFQYLRGITIRKIFSTQDETIIIDGLKSGTTYYYCAFTSDSGYRNYLLGPVKSFTTESMEQYLAVDAVDAKFIDAEVTGHTVFSQSMTGIKYTFFYTQTDIEFPYRNGVTMSLDGNNLTAVITNLFPSHSYECWITAEKDGHTVAQSEKKEFKTQNPSDYILMEDATDITSTSAVINCKLDPYAYEGQNSVHVYFGQDKNNLTRLETARLDGDHLSATLKDLLPNTTYYYRGSALCILSFSWGEWYYSEIKSFTTQP